jgi:hypothetical protein
MRLAAQVYVGDSSHTGQRAVYVGIDKSWGRSHPLQVHHLGFRPDAMVHLFRRSDGHDPAASNRHRFHDSVTGVDSDDLPVEED